MTEFLAALAGAVIGGLATFYASWWQTGRVLQHERQQSIVQAAEERRAAREALGRSSAVEMLLALGDLAVVLPRLRSGGGGWFGGFRKLGEPPPPPSEQDLVVRTLRRLHGSTAQLLSSTDLQQMVDDVLVLVDEMRSASLGPDPDDWQEQTRDRADKDLEAFVAFVRSAFVDYIDGNKVRVAHPPLLRRDDVAVWQPPPWV